MPDLSRRIDRPELMDTETFEPPVIHRALDFLGLTARRFGGSRAILDLLMPWAARWHADATVSILDVGTGGGEIPIAIVRWARATKRRVRVVALDLMPEIAAIARANTAAFPEIEVRCADVFSLRNAGEKFDYVTASLFLHHIPAPRLEDVLALFDALATRGVLLSDLRRSAASYWAVSALSVLAGNHVVRHDGPLSVQRSFTRSELDDLATRAGLKYLRAAAAPWFRLTLAGEKP